MKKTTLTCLSCVAFSLLCVSPGAQAKRAGFSGLTALADAPDTAFWNPAGMTHLNHQLELQLATAYTHSDFKVEESTFGGGDPDSARDINFIPGLYYTRPLNDDWVAGFSINVPSGFGNDYGRHWAGRYLSQETSLVFLSMNPSLAYRWNDLSLAGGLQVMYVDSENSVRVNNIGPRGDGRIKLEEEGIGVGYSLSALYDLTTQTRAGLSYRSEVKVDLDGTPEFRNIDDGYLLLLNSLGLLGEEIDVDFKIPQQLQFGLFHQLNDRISLTADILWIDMSEFGVTSVSAGPDHVSVRSAFKDSYLTTVGVGYQWDNLTELSLGIGYMASPVDNDERTLYLPLDHAFILGAGVTRTLSGGDILGINLEYIDLGDAPVDQENSILTGRVKGRYKNNYATIVDINYRFNL
nr:outer membrane protein transport protein [Aestuariirhabdus litorea]